MDKATEKMLTDAGAKKVPIKKYLAMYRHGKVSEDEIHEASVVDAEGNPTEPHMWIPPGKSLEFYNEDSLQEIKRKIRNKEVPERVTTQKKEKP